MSVRARAHGQLFDPAVTSSTGDVWLAGVDLPGGSAQEVRTVAGLRTATAGRAAGHRDRAPVTGPVTLAPGQHVTITVAITPSGRAGAVVRGQIYLDTFNYFTNSGDELIQVPYAYTVG